MFAAVRAFLRANAIATETSPTPATTALAFVCKTQMETAFATRLKFEGCTNALACNYSDAATEDDGSCILEDALGICDGPCTTDADRDKLRHRHRW